jgi:hypothetical protein
MLSCFHDFMLSCFHDFMISCFHDFMISGIHGDICAVIFPHEEFPHRLIGTMELAGKWGIWNVLCRVKFTWSLSEFCLDLCDMVHGFLNFFDQQLRETLLSFECWHSPFNLFMWFPLEMHIENISRWQSTCQIEKGTERVIFFFFFVSRILIFRRELSRLWDVEVLRYWDMLKAFWGLFEQMSRKLFIFW